MKLCDSNENFVHCKSRDSTHKDLTIMFNVTLNSCLCKGTHIIQKKDEFSVSITKDEEILFSFINKKGCDKEKIKIKSGALSLHDEHSVVILRILTLNKCVMFVDGEVIAAICIDSTYVVPKQSDCNIELLDCANNETITVTNVKIYSDALSLDDILLATLKNKNDVFKFIFNRMGELMNFDDNIYRYHMTKNFFLYFINESKQYGTYENSYPEYLYTMYNIEYNERLLPVATDVTVLDPCDLAKKFKMEEFTRNIVSWQFGMYENDYPKGAYPINAGLTQSGYWNQQLGFTPFTPFLGLTPSAVAFGGGTIYGGNFKNGSGISFVRLLLKQYLETHSGYIRDSINRYVDYLLTHQKGSLTGGIIDEFLGTSANSTQISLKNGNYLNFLKICDEMIECEEITNIIDDTRLELLKLARTKAFDLLLLLQVQVGSTLTIWSTYYEQNATSYLQYASDQNIVTTQTRPVYVLDTLESAEILLYLMNIKNPSATIIKAINSGCEWFKTYKLAQYAQTFNDSTPGSEKLQLTPYKYETLPECQVLHAHYYAIVAISQQALYGPESLTVNSNEPVFIESVAPYFVHTTNTSFFPVNFNTMSFPNQEYAFGTWGGYVTCMYANWKKIYSMPC